MSNMPRLFFTGIRESIGKRPAPALIAPRPSATSRYRGMTFLQPRLDPNRFARLD